jgi:hypothetical protein
MKSRIITYTEINISRRKPNLAGKGGSGGKVIKEAS